MNNSPAGYRLRARHFLTLLLLLFLLQEILFRLIFPLPEVANFNRARYCFATPSQQKVASLSNFSFQWSAEPDGINFIHDLNIYGFRTPANWRVEKESGRERIAVVGDSFVEGMSAPVEETIVEGLRKAESEKKGSKPAEIMNFGMAGANFPDYMRLVREMVPLFRPDRLVLVLYANDVPTPPLEGAWIEDSYVPQFNSFWVPRVYQVIRGIMRQETVPRRWHEKTIPWIKPLPNPTHRLYGKTKEELNYIEPNLLKAMEQGTLNPWLADHLNGVERRLKRPSEVEPYIETLVGFLQKYKTTLHIVYIPHSLQVSDYYVQFQQKYSKAEGVRSLCGPEYQGQAAEIAAVCQRLAVRYLDLTPFLRQEEAAGIHWYCNYDNHMRGPQYLRLGRMMHEWMRQPVPEKVVAEPGA